jgi:hypothetical protein
MAWWMPLSARHGELQERILRDHQRQLNQVGRKVASAEYTPQSMVAEAWRFGARVWGDWADWVRIAYGLDIGRGKDPSGELPVYRVHTAPGGESAREEFTIDSSRLPRKPAKLVVSALKSSETDYTIPGENISFKPAEVKADIRGEQTQLVIVTKLTFDGNKAKPGLYTGTIRAETEDGSRVLGLLMLEVAGKGG